MARTPQNLDEAKQIFREEKSKVTGSLSAIAGSRWLMAILATAVIAFGTHLYFAPQRLPALTISNVTALGLPPGLDFGLVGEQAQQAMDAAARSEARSEIANRFSAEAAANPNFVRTINAIGFGAALLLLFGNMWIMTKRRRFSRG